LGSVRGCITGKALTPEEAEEELKKVEKLVEDVEGLL
jgi:hypothetical protein